MKQTAIDWLIGEIHKNLGFIPEHIQQQAKEMERQQIEEAAECQTEKSGMSGSEYYEQTYGGDE